MFFLDFRLRGHFRESGSNFRLRSHFRCTGTSWGLTSDRAVTSARCHFRGLRSNFLLRGYFRWTREWLPVVKSLPVVRLLPGVLGTSCEVTSGRTVTSGGLSSDFRGTGGVTSGGVTWAKTMVVTSISHMGEMRDSDWSRPNFLRSDWLPTIWAMYTTPYPADKYYRNQLHYPMDRRFIQWISSSSFWTTGARPIEWKLFGSINQTYLS